MRKLLITAMVLAHIIVSDLSAQDVYAQDGYVPLCHPDNRSRHCLTVTWMGAGSPALRHRVAWYVPINSLREENPDRWHWEWVEGLRGTKHTPTINRDTNHKDYMRKTPLFRFAQWWFRFDLGDPDHSDPRCWKIIRMGSTYEPGIDMTRATMVRIDTCVSGRCGEPDYPSWTIGPKAIIR